MESIILTAIKNHRTFWSASSGLRLGLATFLLLPFWILLVELKNLSLPPLEQVSVSFVFTFTQAILSATFVLLLGLWSAFGIIKLNQIALLKPRLKRVAQAFELACATPTLMPSLFIILAGLNFFKPFPFGLWGIVLLHTLTHLGIIAIVLSRTIQAKTGAFAELALIEGASFVLFASTVIRYLRRDFAVIFLFVFASCFSSFAIPLVVGRSISLSWSTTWEVLIFEKINIEMQWSQALGLATLQSIVFLFLAWFLGSRRTNLTSMRYDLSLLGKSSGIIWPALAIFILVGGMLSGFKQGWRELFLLPNILSIIGTAALGTLFVGIGVGFTTLIILALVAGLWPSVILQRFLLGYVAPSSALTGAALLYLGPNFGLWVYIKIILAVTLLSIPYLYRLAWDNTLEPLRHQIFIAHSLGASRLLIFFEIIWPRIQRSACLLAGLASFWSCGEFAVSSILAPQPVTLGLLAQSLIHFYKLEAATVLVGFILALGITCFFLIQWLVPMVFHKMELLRTRRCPL